MKKQQISIVNGVLTVEYPTIGKKFVTDLSKYGQPVQDAAVQHGFKQKFGDAESGGTPAEKYAMVQRIHQGLLEGNWELVGERDNSAIVVQAVMNLKKLKVAQIEKVLEKLPDAATRKAKVKEWSAKAAVKAEIAKIRAARAAKIAEEADEDEVEIEL